MSNLNVLHIVPWFPNPKNKIEGVFISEHIKALNLYCKNSVLHIQFGKSNYEKDEINDIFVERVTLKPFSNKWLFKERKASAYIENYLKKNGNKFNIVNFYISYPNAIKINKFNRIFPEIKFTISEQWSAYHTGFNLEKGQKGRNRIENIFKNNIPLFVVSNALGKDIRNFIGNQSRDFKVIPNCINPKIFTYKEKNVSDEFIFSSINNWSEMKNPFVLINAFNKIVSEYENCKLIIAGDGVLMPKMKSLIKKLKLESKISIIGKIPKNEVVSLLQKSNVYCQSSNYETFSAICIESLSTGTPVIATNIGGMKDFINEKNGTLVDNLEMVSWAKAMKSLMLNYAIYNLNSISKDVQNKYRIEKIGSQFHQHLLKLLDEK